MHEVGDVGPYFWDYITLDINYGYRDAIASLIELNTFGLMPACFVDSEYGC